MRRDREHEPDFAHVGGEMDAATHSPKDGVAGWLAQATRPGWEQARRQAEGSSGCARMSRHLGLERHRTGSPFWRRARRGAFRFREMLYSRGTGLLNCDASKQWRRQWHCLMMS